MSILRKQVKDGINLSDKVIASNMLASATASANAYLNATMVSSTPEFRAICKGSLDEILSGHAQLVQLAVKHSWMKPYESPSQQLSETFGDSAHVAGITND